MRLCLTWIEALGVIRVDGADTVFDAYSAAFAVVQVVRSTNASLQESTFEGLRHSAATGNFAIGLGCFDSGVHARS